MMRTHPGRAYPKRGKAKSEMLCLAFLEGASWSVKPFSVYYGVDQWNLDRWRREMADPNHDVYNIDNSFFDITRGSYFRVAKNRMQVRAGDHGSDGKRFDALGLMVRPWWRQSIDGHWLVVEQSPAFMRDVACDPDWLDRTTAGLLASGRDIRVRRWSADKPKLAATLQDDLRECWHLVTHSSAAAVEAMLAGIPVIVDRMSAVANVVCSINPSLDGRRQAMGVLADNSFSLTELRSGLAWSMIQERA